MAKPLISPLLSYSGGIEGLSYSVRSKGLAYSVCSDRLCSKCEEVSELTMLS